MPLPRRKKLTRVNSRASLNIVENWETFVVTGTGTPVPSSPVRSRATIFIKLSPLPNSSLITFPQVIYLLVCWFDNDMSRKGHRSVWLVRREGAYSSGFCIKLIWNTNVYFGDNKWKKMKGGESSRSMIPEFSYILYILYMIMKYYYLIFCRYV